MSFRIELFLWKWKRVVEDVGDFDFSEISKFSIFSKKIPRIRIHIDSIFSYLGRCRTRSRHLEELEGGDTETFFMRKLLVLGDIEERKGEHPSPRNVIFNYPGRLNNNNPILRIDKSWGTR